MVYLGSAPKSNAAYRGIGRERRRARDRSLMPPKHILNADALMGPGLRADYEYDHEAPDAFSGQNYFPEGLERRRLSSQSDRGFEREIAARLAEWEKLRAARANGR